MRSRLLIILVVVLIPAFVVPVQGSIFRKSAPKTDPATRVPELLSTIKTDKDDRKRTSAIEELRNVDAKTYPEIVPVLIDALLQDQRPNVRWEAAQTLGRIRPPSAAAAQALEQAASRDSSRWVRLHSRTALVGYKVAGVGAKKTDETTNTPPAKSALKAPTPAPKALTTAPPPRIVDKAPTPVVKTTPATNSSVPRPLPSDNTSWSTAVPVAPGRATPPPALLGDGPVLAPPR